MTELYAVVAGGSVLFAAVMYFIIVRQSAQKTEQVAPLSLWYDPGTFKVCDPPFLSMSVGRKILTGTRGLRETEIWVEGPKNGTKYDHDRGYVMRIAVPSALPFGFRAGPEDWTTELGKSLHVLQDMQIGRPLLDKALRFSSAEPIMFSSLAGRPGFLDALDLVLLDKSFTGIEVADGKLLYWRKTLRIATLTDADGMKGALAAVDALAAALA